MCTLRQTHHSHATCLTLANMPCFLSLPAIIVACPYTRTNFTEWGIQVISFFAGAADHVRVIEQRPKLVDPTHPSVAADRPMWGASERALGVIMSTASKLHRGLCKSGDHVYNTGRNTHAAAIKNLVATPNAGLPRSSRGPGSQYSSGTGVRGRCAPLGSIDSLAVVPAVATAGCESWDCWSIPYWYHRHR